MPAGHKVAVTSLRSGDAVVKYGCPIGVATCDIAAGEWVHSHNVRSNLSGEQQYTYNPRITWKTQDPASVPKFEGYVRPDGQVGIRNDIWIIPTVGCVNGTADMLTRLGGLNSGVPDDGRLIALKHPLGCSQLGDDHDNTRRILADMVHHPNAGAVLVLGLGCENNTMQSFRELIGDVDERRVKFLVCQNVSDEVEAGRALLDELIKYAAESERESVPMSELRIGLKCGGSDAFSGLTANPLIGSLCDWLVASGGSAVLTEVPEMFGAETILFERCVNEQVFGKAVDMVNGFKRYFLQHGEPVGENPSPGNRRGGITTLEEKSLGCVQKAGCSPVEDVLLYGDTISCRGVSLLEGPGNDIVAVTALAAAGCHMILFSTGCGTPLGGPVPVVKISSTSALFERKPHWIDFDAGTIIDGEPMDELTLALADHLLGVASGAVPVLSELNNFHDLAIWKSGITL